MKLDDILRLPNRRPYSNIELNIINRFLKTFANMSYAYHSEDFQIHDPKVLPFLQAGILGIRNAGFEPGGSTLVVKLSGGKGFFGGERIQFHVFDADNLYGMRDDFSETSTWKMLSRVLVKIANSDHY